MARKVVAILLNGNLQRRSEQEGVWNFEPMTHFGELQKAHEFETKRIAKVSCNESASP